MGNKHETLSDGTYHTREGYDIPLEGHSPEFFENLEEKIDKWLDGWTDTITSEWTDEMKDYVANHLEWADENTSFTRVGNGSHFLGWDGPRVGDFLKDDSLYRSFSRTRDATLEVLEAKDESIYTEEPWVIYRTVGPTPFFDPTKFSNRFPEQQEIFIPPNSMKVRHIGRYDLGEWGEGKRLTRDLGFSRQPHIAANEIVVVDLEYEAP